MSEKIKEKVAQGWGKLRLSDVCEEISARISNPSESEFDRFVGLEHMDTGETKLKNYGATTDLVSAMKLFKAGDVLVARRNVYLRRAAVADFDGVCSGDAIVLRPKSNQMVVNGVLQFILNTDSFWEYAIKHAAGTMSKRLSVDRLLGFEFVLPPTEEQVKAVKLLSAVQEKIESLENLFATQKNVYHAAIDAEYKFSVGYPKAKLVDVTSKIVDGVHKRPDYVEAGVPFLAVENLTRSTGIDFSKTRFVSAEDHAEYTKRAKPEKGDVLVSKDGTLGVARLIETDIDFSIFVSLALLKPRKDVLDGRFLRYFFDCSHFRRRIGQKTSGSAILHIHLIDFRQTEIPLPEYANQVEIAKQIREIEELMEATQSRILDTKNLASTVRCSYFGS